MAIDVDNLFKGMKDAHMGRPKTYMGYGNYEVELDDLLVKNSDKDGAPVFVCRFKILASDNPAHAVGSEGSWSLKGPTLQYGMGDIKALMVAILGVDPRGLAAEHPAQAAASLLLRFVLGSSTAQAEVAAMKEEQRPKADFYKGKRLALVCRPKSETKPFTRHFWSPLAKAA